MLEDLEGWKIWSSNPAWPLGRIGSFSLDIPEHQTLFFNSTISATQTLDAGISSTV